MYDIGKVTVDNNNNEGLPISRTSQKNNQSHFKTVQSIEMISEKSEEKPQDKTLDEINSSIKSSTLKNNKLDYSYTDFETSSFYDNKRKITINSDKIEKKGKESKMQRFLKYLKEKLSLRNIKKSIESSFIEVLITGYNILNLIIFFFFSNIVRS